MAANPVLSASSESLLSSDLTPSSTVTAEMDEPGHQDGTFEPVGSKISYVEVETAINFLKRSRSQVLMSADTDPRSKRIMDALIEIVIGGFYPHPEGKDHFGEQILKKTQTVLLCFIFCVLAVAVAVSFGSAVPNSFRGPLPT